jgi:uncharacterized protein
MSAVPGQASLRAFLADPGRPAGTLTYHELEGFLFTVASAPELILPSEWLSIVFGEQDAAYRSLTEAKTMLGHIMALYNDVNRTVSGERAALPADCPFHANPLDNFEDAAPVAQWSRGFLLGHQWLEDLWNVDLPDDLDEELAAILMTLSFFASRDMADRFRAEGLAPQRSLAEMAKSMHRVFPDAVAGYAQLGRTLAKVIAKRDTAPSEPRRAVKIGRNDVCPCGSGKKFKRCCGTTVH